jgi:hypothetical protein
LRGEKRRRGFERREGEGLREEKRRRGFESREEKERV